MCLLLVPANTKLTRRGGEGFYAVREILNLVNNGTDV